MEWILIIWMNLSQGGGIATIPMQTKGACVQAMVISEEGRGVPYNTTYCISTLTGEVINRQ